MISFIDNILDRTTMYRLVLYYLIAILLVAVVEAAFGGLPYSPWSILGSTAFLVVGCGLANYVFGQVFEVPTNYESSYITALILACILPPLRNAHDLPLLFWGASLAIGSKYILAIRGKHLFNPAAIAVLLTAFWLNQPATWWVGTPALAITVLVGGALMVRKLRRYDMGIMFYLGAIAVTALNAHDVLHSLNQLFLQSSLLFFSFVMLTEPLTSPTTNVQQGIYGLLVGILFAPATHIGTYYFTPEQALVIGNIYAYIVSPKVRERLRLVHSQFVAAGVAELEFVPSRPFLFQPGQYMEFTLSHPHADARGTRRYLTLASSPTEKTVKLGVKFYDKPSTFKQHLAAMGANDLLMAGQIAGDFTLPKDAAKKLAFIAGGIGVTPFRSMLKYLADTGERRDISLLYVNRTADEIAYADIFNAAPVRTTYVLTGEAPAGWTGRTGRVDEEALRQEIPDYKERTFYLSGPHPMVTATESLLRRMGLPQRQIKKDFFPGLA